MDDKIIFQEKIKQIMKKAEMNVSQFSEATGINISTLSQILNGNNKASLEVLTKIKNRFNFISTEWLFLNKGEMSVQIDNSQSADLFNKTNVTASNPITNEPPQIPKNLPENNPNERKQESVSFQQNPPQIQQVFVEKSQKKIIRITVYFDDNSYQDLVEI